MSRHNRERKRVKWAKKGLQPVKSKRKVVSHTFLEGVLVTKSYGRRWFDECQPVDPDGLDYIRIQKHGKRALQQIDRNERHPSGSNYSARKLRHSIPQKVFVPVDALPVAD